MVDAAGQILQVSANIADFVQRSPNQLLGTGITDLFTPSSWQRLLTHVAGMTPSDLVVIQPTLVTPDHQEIAQYGYFHPHPAGGYILELSPLNAATAPDPLYLYQRLQGAVTQLQLTTTLEELAQTAVQAVQALTQYDRVMLYRFNADWHGQVLAEVTRSKQESYLGLNFPAIDIPTSARQLFYENRVRTIPQVQHPAIPLIPAQHPLTAAPLDLRALRLRGVSACHQRYLHHMGTGASLTLALIKADRLWGLIACHHPISQHLPHNIQAVCELLAQMVSLELNLKTEGQNQAYRQQIRTTQSILIAAIANTHNITEALLQNEAHVLHLVQASGAFLSFDGIQTAIGKTPTAMEIHLLLDWLAPQLTDGLFYTESLGQQYPPAENFSVSTAGLLVISVSQFRPYYILWFRPEVAQTVNWAGNPDRQEHFTNLPADLHPTLSFQIWKDQVRGRSHPWQECEVDVVISLKTAILHQQLKRSQAETEVLIKEVHHRVKNNLQIVDSLLRQQARRAQDNSTLQALKDCHNRVLSMALVHEHLYESSTLSQIPVKIYLNRLVSDLRDSYGFHSSQQRLQVQADNLSIDIDMAIPLGLIVSELVSNAIKYAFPDQRAGLIQVICRQDHQYLLHLMIQDDGVGLQEGFDINKTRSLGLKLVRSLVRQLNGEIQIMRQVGTQFEITVARPLLTLERPLHPMDEPRSSS